MRKWCHALVLALALSTSATAEPSKAVEPSEVAVLKAQVETMRDYQDRFISMVQWSLGTVVTVTIGLLAFGWFTNRTSYERDREALRQERDALRHELKALVSDEIRQVKKDLDTALSELEKPLREKLEKAISAKVSAVNGKFESLHGDILDLRAVNIEREADEASASKNYSWAIYRYCDALALSVKRQADHYEVPEILDRMKKVLEAPNVRLDADDVTRTVETLSRLPSRYQAAAEKLIAMAKGLL